MCENVRAIFGLKKGLVASLKIRAEWDQVQANLNIISTLSKYYRLFNPIFLLMFESNSNNMIDCLRRLKTIGISVMMLLLLSVWAYVNAEYDYRLDAERPIYTHVIRWLNIRICALPRCQNSCTFIFIIQSRITSICEINSRGWLHHKRPYFLIRL